MRWYSYVRHTRRLRYRKVRHHSKASNRDGEIHDTYSHTAEDSPIHSFTPSLMESYGLPQIETWKGKREEGIGNGELGVGNDADEDDDDNEDELFLCHSPTPDKIEKTLLPDSLLPYSPTPAV